MSSEADLKSEIARLTASINQHKSTLNNAPPPGNGYSSRGRGGYRGSYGTGGYSSHRYQPTNRWMNNKYIRPGLEAPSTSNEPTQTPSDSAGPSGVSVAESTSASASSSGKVSPGLLNGEVDNKGTGATATAQSVTAFGNGTKEVVIDGVAFESSARSLVRKDLPKPKPSVSKPPSTSFPSYVRKAGHLISASRSYKPKSRRGRGRGRNLTLDNTRKSWSERMEVKRRKYSNKPCPRFNTTGELSLGILFLERGNVCPAQ